MDLEYLADQVSMEDPIYRNHLLKPSVVMLSPGQMVTSSPASAKRMVLLSTSIRTTLEESGAQFPEVTKAL